jgi:hypothetical protein
VSTSPWRQILTPFVVATLLAATAGVGTLVAPRPAAAILCTVVNPCYTFAVVMTGTGQAEVTADGGIDCVISGTVVSGTCSARFYGTAVVNLAATGQAHTCTTMLGGTECGGVQPAQWSMNGQAYDYDVFVHYQQPIDVQVQKGGTGSGRVVSTTYPGIDCGSACTGTQPGGITDTFQETPDAGSVFAGWGVVCTGTSATCSFARTTTVLLTATFDKVATPPPTPSPTPHPTATPGASPSPTRTPGASSSQAPNPTPTAGAGQTIPASSPGSSPAPLPTPDASAVAGASPAATEPVASAAPSESNAMTAGSSGGIAPAETSAPAGPTGASSDGGTPPWVLLILALLVVLIGAGGLAFRARKGRSPAG